MSRKINLIIFLCFILCEVYAQYVPDVLGDGYLRRTFQMPDDYEGKVVCTLVKKPQLDSVKQAVLYIHGYNDYFFQKQLGDSVNAHGYNFYAMDLRKYGRSILPNQNPFFCKSLKEYFADIDTALATIQSEGNERILLMAHSTGGLITPYYLNSKKGELPIDGLILNSPFLDWNFGWFMEKVVLPTVAFVGRLFPNLTVQGLGDPNYAYRWIKAIQEAQQAVQKGLKLDCPILVMSSNNSFPETETWHEEYMTSDIVLDVQDIQKYGEKLGDKVTRDTIPNGIHDLILSQKPYRNDAYQTIFEWLKKQ